MLLHDSCLQDLKSEPKSHQNNHPSCHMQIWTRLTEQDRSLAPPDLHSPQSFGPRCKAASPDHVTETGRLSKSPPGLNYGGTLWQHSDLFVVTGSNLTCLSGFISGRRTHLWLRASRFPLFSTWSAEARSLIPVSTAEDLSLFPRRSFRRKCFLRVSHLQRCYLLTELFCFHLWPGIAWAWALSVAGMFHTVLLSHLDGIHLHYLCSHLFSDATPSKGAASPSWCLQRPQ